MPSGQSAIAPCRRSDTQAEGSAPALRQGSVTQGRWTVLPGMELLSCPDLAVPRDVMHHVVKVESSFNPYAIGVVGGRLQRQPKSLSEALATVRMLEGRGFNFSLGLAQVNRHNLAKYGLTSYEQAFQSCPNLVAGSRILAECHGRSGQDWGKSFSCYYSGNFTTGFRHGYVQKVYASMQRGQLVTREANVIPVIGGPARKRVVPSRYPGRIADGPPPQRVGLSPVSAVVPAGPTSPIDAEPVRVGYITQEREPTAAVGSELPALVRQPEPAEASAAPPKVIARGSSDVSDAAFVF